MADGEKKGNRIGNGISNESVKLIAESVGIHGMPEEALQQMADDVSYRLRMLVQDSKKFMIDGKRKRLSTFDVEHALKVRAYEPLYGFHSKESIPFRHASGGGRDVHFTEENEIDLQEFLSSSLPKVPLEVSIRSHWLSIEGVQPSVPENPPPISRDLQKLESIDPTVKVSSILPKLKMNTDPGKIKSRVKAPEKVRIKEVTTHELSIEQQIYYKEITEACAGSDENRRVEALNSLVSDPGLYQMLPRLSNFIAEGVKCNIVQNNLALLIYLQRMIKSLMENTSLNLEKYLHELVPPLLSCIVSRQLCLRPDFDNHWALRDFAARLISQICRTYNTSTNNIQLRITRQLGSILLNDSAPLATLYGAIVALSDLGSEVVKVFILPHVKSIANRLSSILDNSMGNSIVTNIDRTAADHVKSALLKMLPPVINKVCPPPDILEEYRAEYGSLGAALHAAVLKLRQSTAPASQPSAVMSARPMLSVGQNRPQLISSQILQNSPSSSLRPPAPRLSYPVTAAPASSSIQPPKFIVITSQQRPAMSNSSNPLYSNLTNSPAGMVKLVTPGGLPSSSTAVGSSTRVVMVSLPSSAQTSSKTLSVQDMGVKSIFGNIERPESN